MEEWSHEVRTRTYHLLLVQNVPDTGKDNDREQEANDQHPRVVWTLDALAVHAVVSKRTYGASVTCVRLVALQPQEQVGVWQSERGERERVSGSDTGHKTTTQEGDRGSEEPKRGQHRTGRIVPYCFQGTTQADHTATVLDTDFSCSLV